MDRYRFRSPTPAARSPPTRRIACLSGSGGGDPARTETGMHAGLGLSVCRNMMSLLRGSIAARSQLGGEFIVEIGLGAAIVQPDFILAV